MDRVEIRTRNQDRDRKKDWEQILAEVSTFNKIHQYQYRMIVTRANPAKAFIKTGGHHRIVKDFYDFLDLLPQNKPSFFLLDQDELPIRSKGQQKGFELTSILHELTGALVKYSNNHLLLLLDQKRATPQDYIRELCINYFARIKPALKL